MKINFINLKNIFIRFKITKSYNEVLKLLHIDGKKLVVNIGYVSETAIQKLNNEHRNVDKVTDVLSFPLIDLKIGQWVTSEIYEQEKHPVTGMVDLGDIIICENVAKLQAQKYGHSFKREVCFLAVHGFLHVLGFDHMTPEDEKNMFSLTEKVLQNTGVKR